MKQPEINFNCLGGFVLKTGRGGENMGTGKVALGGGVGNLLIMVDTRVEGLCE